MELDDVMRRVRKCLALSKSDNAGEAAAALRQAQKLMELYNVTPEGLAQAEIAEAQRKSTACTRPPEWEAYLAGTVARAFRCNLLWVNGAFSTELNRDLFKGKWEFIGVKHEVQLAAYTFEVLLRQLLRARDHYLKQWKLDNRFHTLKEKLVASNDFSEGFAHAVGRQVNNIAEQTPELKDAIEKRTLVLRGSVSKEVTTTSRDEGDYEAWAAGKEKGSDAHLHRPMEGTEQLKLGSTK